MPIPISQDLARESWKARSCLLTSFIQKPSGGTVRTRLSNASEWFPARRRKRRMPQAMKTCSVCTNVFRCGSTEEERCWCDQYPPVKPDLQVKDCLCPECLAERCSEVQ